MTVTLDSGSLNLDVLRVIWEKAGQETNSPAETLTTWLNFVSKWAKLEEYQQKLYLEADLWLPTNDEKELSTLVGLAILANGLNCSPVLLAEILLASSPESKPENSSTQTKAKTEPTLAEIEGAKSNSEVTTEPEITIITSEIRTLLLDQLSSMQMTFAQALEVAGQKIDAETFPATDLQDYLADLCSYIRQILNAE